MQKDGVIITTHDGTQLKAKMIIGSDGVHSNVQSALTNARETLVETYPGISSYYKNVKGIEQDCLEIHFL